MLEPSLACLALWFCHWQKHPKSWPGWCASKTDKQYHLKLFWLILFWEEPGRSCFSVFFNFFAWESFFFLFAAQILIQIKVQLSLKLLVVSSEQENCLWNVCSVTANTARHSGQIASNTIGLDNFWDSENVHIFSPLSEFKISNKTAAAKIFWILFQLQTKIQPKTMLKCLLQRWTKVNWAGHKPDVFLHVVMAKTGL